MITFGSAHSHNFADVITHPASGLPVYSRVPASLWTKLNANAQQRGLFSAGCELRFRATGESLTFRIRCAEVFKVPHGRTRAQILCGDFSLAYVPIENEETVFTVALPNSEKLRECAPNPFFDPRLVRLLLPNHSAIVAIEIDGETSPPEPGDVPARRMLSYGSSITQGAFALGARETWGGRCAYLLKADWINLGFGGGCHCEPEMADYLATRSDCDFITLETGINMLGMDKVEADRRIEHLIRTVAAAHPTKPIFCLGVFGFGDDLRSQSRSRAQEIRELVAQVVASIDSPRVHFIDGRHAFDIAYGLSTDLVHPSPAGSLSIGHYVADQMRPLL